MIGDTFIIFHFWLEPDVYLQSDPDKYYFHYTVTKQIYTTLAKGHIATDSI
jgi:hypothetical protein